MHKMARLRESHTWRLLDWQEMLHGSVQNRATHWTKSECNAHVDAVTVSVVNVPSTADEMRRSLASALEQARQHFDADTSQEIDVRASVRNGTMQCVSDVQLETEGRDIVSESVAKGALNLPLVSDPEISWQTDIPLRFCKHTVSESSIDDVCCTSW
jgi:hypothetical protein